MKKKTSAKSDEGASGGGGSFKDCQSQSSIVTRMPFKTEVGPEDYSNSPFAMDVTKTEEIKTTMKVRRDKGKLRYVITKESSFTVDGSLSGGESSASSTHSVVKLINKNPVMREMAPLEMLTASTKKAEKFHEEGHQTSEEVSVFVLVSTVLILFSSNLSTDQVYQSRKS